MKTQEITVTIKATVPVGKYCCRNLSNEESELEGSDFENVYKRCYVCRHFEDERGEPYCEAFHELIKESDGRHIKIPQCLDACANGTE